MQINMPLGAEAIIDTLQSAGFEGYIVGGCIRDSLMGIEPKDWDITTNARPDEIKVLFPKTYDTGIKFGTVSVSMEDGIYEVTTYRKDGRYSDGRHPDEVQFAESLKEDLSRRDFAMNAMAYSPAEGLIDPYGGIEDLEMGYISCVGNPEERFTEDPLRILRAMRFASVKGLRIHETTADAMKALAGKLDLISQERIMSEFRKIVSGYRAARVLRTFPEVVAQIIPEAIPMFGFDQKSRYHIYDVWEHTLHAIECAPSVGYEEVCCLALFFHDIGKPHCYTEDDKGYGHFYGHSKISHKICKEVMRRMRFNNETVALVSELVLFHDSEVTDTPKAVKRWLNKIGPDQLKRLLFIKKCDILAHSIINRDSRLAAVERTSRLLEDILAAGEPFDLKHLAIGGKDLIELGMEPGPEMGKVLQSLLDKVIAGEVENLKEKLLEELR